MGFGSAIVLYTALLRVVEETVSFFTTLQHFALARSRKPTISHSRRHINVWRKSHSFTSEI